MEGQIYSQNVHCRQYNIQTIIIILQYVLVLTLTRNLLDDVQPICFVRSMRKHTLGDEMKWIIGFWLSRKSVNSV